MAPSVSILMPRIAIEFVEPRGVERSRSWIQRGPSTSPRTFSGYFLGPSVRICGRRLELFAGRAVGRVGGPKAACAGRVFQQQEHVQPVTDRAKGEADGLPKRRGIVAGVPRSGRRGPRRGPSLGAKRGGVRQEGESPREGAERNGGSAHDHGARAAGTPGLGERSHRVSVQSELGGHGGR